MNGMQWYHYPLQYRQLIAATKNHRMRVLHEDGLYRHLRFQKPETSIWSWDLVTWPGSLAVRGDIGEGLIFTRETDMIRFFDQGQPAGHINPSYWAEKLPGGEHRVKEFSPELFDHWVQHQGGRIESARCLEVGTTQEAVELLDEHDVVWDFEDPELWQDFRHHVILAMHAILWGAKKYHSAARTSGGES